MATALSKCDVTSPPSAGEFRYGIRVLPLLSKLMRRHVVCPEFSKDDETGNSIAQDNARPSTLC